MYIFKRFLLILFLFGSLLGCKKHTPDRSRVPILEVEGKFLYLDQLEQVLVNSAGAADSIELAESFIKKWVTDILLYENAKRNVTNKAAIDKLLEDYRKSLIIHQYQQNVIQERLPAMPREEELLDFYNHHKDQLRLKECVLKGKLIVLPSGAPNTANLRKWVKTGDLKSLELIEKYCLQHGLSYDYFADRWVSLSEISKKIPTPTEVLSQALSNGQFYEIQDSLKLYMLQVDSIRKHGAIEPYDTSKEKIASFIMNQRKTDFITDFENELYNDAVNNGIVTFFNN